MPRLPTAAMWREHGFEFDHTTEARLLEPLYDDAEVLMLWVDAEKMFPGDDDVDLRLRQGDDVIVFPGSMVERLAMELVAFVVAYRAKAGLDA